MVRKDSNEKGIEAFDVTVRSSSTHIGIRKWIGFPIRIASIQYMSKMMNTDVYLLLLHDTPRLACGTEIKVVSESLL